MLVGTEHLDGIAATHVRGDVDTAALVAAIGRAVVALGSATSPADPADVAEAARQAQRFVKRARVDLWVGVDDHRLARLDVDADLAFEGDARERSGVERLRIRLTVGAIPVAAPNVAAPHGARPAEERSGVIGVMFIGNGDLGVGIG